VPAAPMAGGNEARCWNNDTDRLPTWMRRTGPLLWTLLLGTLCVGLQALWANSVAPPVARQESREAKAGDPARPVDLPTLPPALDLPSRYASVREVLEALSRDDKCSPSRHTVLRNPVAPRAPAVDTKPISTASLYDRVRQVVLENKTEETERLGIGDIAYRDVAADGSIMVGMEVTYAPFFTHYVIKSVQPIYQRPDGLRYDGPVCGNPTLVGERVVAKPGYAIGGAAIRSGMGIDGMQLTFMEIGVDGLNPHRAYLSQWLGGYGGADAKTYLNDGRPILGIAGMVSKLNFGPAFCMCLVTTKAGAIADADVLGPGLLLVNNVKQRDAKQFDAKQRDAKQLDDRLNPTGQNARPAAAAAEPVGPPLRTTPVPEWHTTPASGKDR